MAKGWLNVSTKCIRLKLVYRFLGLYNWYINSITSVLDVYMVLCPWEANRILVSANAGLDIEWEWMDLLSFIDVLVDFTQCKLILSLLTLFFCPWHQMVP